jgi:hypothetical protein
MDIDYYNYEISKETGSDLDDGIYWRLDLKSLLFTINYSAVANLPAPQIAKTCFILVLRFTPCTFLYSYSRTLQINHWTELPSIVDLGRTSRKTYVSRHYECLLARCLALGMTWTTLKYIFQ